MLKRSLEGLTMLALVVGITLAATAVSVTAQTANRVITADVPFSFIIGDKNLSAGKYYLTRGSAGNEVLMIRNRNGQGAFRLTSHTSETSGKKSVKLVFHRYADQYFLSEVWSGSVGRILQKSNRERALEREMATIASKSERVSRGYEIVEVVASLN
jgi:hypothetical protein